MNCPSWLHLYCLSGFHATIQFRTLFITMKSIIQCFLCTMAKGKFWNKNKTKTRQDKKGFQFKYGSLKKPVSNKLATSNVKIIAISEWDYLAKPFKWLFSIRSIIQSNSWAKMTIDLSNFWAVINQGHQIPMHTDIASYLYIFYGCHVQDCDKCENNKNDQAECENADNFASQLVFPVFSLIPGIILSVLHL